MPSRIGRPVLIVWFVVLLVSQGPYLRATLAPPAGATFIGSFHWLDDVQNYLSLAAQAENGRWLFSNKLYAPPHAPAMLNPEFLVVGSLARLPGVDVFVAFRLFGIFASLALLAGIDRLLMLAGVRDTHRLPALLLTSLGGGLGGWLFVTTDLPAGRLLDLASGLFPFMGFVANAHWTGASALLVWCGVLVTRSPQVPLLVVVLLATTMGFTRPYEPCLLLAGLAAIAIRHPEWRRPGVIIAIGLLPWLAYQLWLSLSVPAFAFITRLRYPPFGLPESVWALGPAAILALTALRAPGSAEAERVRLFLAGWATVALGVLAIRVSGSQSQALVGVGIPLLCLASVGLSRFELRYTWYAACLLSMSAAVASMIVWREDPNWFVRTEERTAVRALRNFCRPDETVLAPPDVGLQIGALTPCRAYVSHSVAPGFSQSPARVAAFYRGDSPEARQRLLDDACAAHFLAPGEAEAEAWLPPSSGFRRVAQAGRGARAISIYSRPAPSCRPAVP